MARLKALPPKVGTLPPRIGAAPKNEAERSRQRASEQEWRSWYWLKRWDDLRIAVFARDMFICQRTGEFVMGKHPAPDSPVANHIKPHRGDPKLFWDINNIETVSKAVHDREIQREEQAQPRGRWD